MTSTVSFLAVALDAVWLGDNRQDFDGRERQFTRVRADIGSDSEPTWIHCSPNWGGLILWTDIDPA